MSPAGLVVNYNFIQLTRIEILRSSVQPAADRAPAQLCSERCVKICTAPSEAPIGLSPNTLPRSLPIGPAAIASGFLRFVAADPNILMIADLEAFTLQKDEQATNLRGGRRPGAILTSR